MVKARLWISDQRHSGHFLQIPLYTAVVVAYANAEDETDRIKILTMLFVTKNGGRVM